VALLHPHVKAVCTQHATSSQFSNGLLSLTLSHRGRVASSLHFITVFPRFTNRAKGEHQSIESAAQDQGRAGLSRSTRIVGWAAPDGPEAEVLVKGQGDCVGFIDLEKELAYRSFA